MDAGYISHTKGELYDFNEDMCSINDEGNHHSFEIKKRKGNKHFKKHFKPYSLTFATKKAFAKAIIKYGELYNDNGSCIYFDSDFGNPFRICDENRCRDVTFMLSDLFGETYYTEKPKPKREFESECYYWARFEKEDKPCIVEFVKQIDGSGVFFCTGDEHEYEESDFYKIYDKIEPNENM